MSNSRQMAERNLITLFLKPMDVTLLSFEIRSKTMPSYREERRTRGIPPCPSRGRQTEDVSAQRARLCCDPAKCSIPAYRDVGHQRIWVLEVQRGGGRGRRWK